ncbi:MAG: hypothetical protein D6679_00690 [Candidatus Hydrogenedentota bacterium]|nr:MAG: hypothetical protein D6679_00690 [Candidatus Hydrogenedentota bacterium]
MKERFTPRGKEEKKNPNALNPRVFWGLFLFFISSSVISVSLWCILFFGNLQNSGPDTKQRIHHLPDVIPGETARSDALPVIPRRA